jgi:hypothetical protein
MTERAFGVLKEKWRILKLAKLSYGKASKDYTCMHAIA